MIPTATDLEAIALFWCGYMYPPYFHEWDKLVQNHRRLLVIASRDHGKTTFFSKLVPLHAVIKRVPEILIVSYSETQVLKIVSSIKDLCDNRERLRRLRPVEGLDWSKSALQFSTGSRIDTLTFGSSGRGGHYDLIITDDPVKDFSGMDPDDQEDYYKRALTPMCKPTGQMITVGNYVYNGDLIERLESNKAYHRAFYPAINGKMALWPERWNLEALEARRIEIGDFAFNREYLLQKIDQDSMFFKRETVHYYDEAPERLAKIMSVDPAITVDGDHTGIVLTGTSMENKTYVLDYANLRTDSIQKILDTIMDLAVAHQVNYLKMESIGFQRLLRHWLDDEMRKRNYFFGIEEIKSHSASKQARIMALQPRLQSGSLLFKESQGELVQQLLSFPHGKYDDLIDALAMQVGSWDRPPEITQEAPPGSFDWWLKQTPGEAGDYRKDLFADLINAD